MVSLIDTNVIIRFLVGDHKEHLKQSKKIFTQIQDGILQVEILSEVLMEVLFVVVKQYKVPKAITIEKLKGILLLEGVVNSDKMILLETLNMFLDKNIDYVDALICTKAKLEGYSKTSFDKDVMRKCES
jgi:predicted nucleic-acid-binding protein